MARTPFILAREANVIRVAFDDPKPPPRFPGAAGARVPANDMEQQAAAIAAGTAGAPAHQYCG